MNRLPKDFNWKVYLQLNPDLGRAGIRTQIGAINHWFRHGNKENRKYNRSKQIWVIGGKYNKLAIYIYNPEVFYINTIKNYDVSFSKFSKKNIVLVDYRKLDNINNVKSIIISPYIVHNIINNPNYLKKISNFKCRKIMFVQDDYYDILAIRNMIKILKIDTIFTCMRGPDIQKIYPFPHIKFVSILTGYVDENSKNQFKLIKDKNVTIFYRGRNLHKEYGKLGILKKQIGVVMKQYANKHNISNDIEWEENKRIYKDQWITTLSNAKVTLGTPSGSNVKNMYNPYNNLHKLTSIKEELNVGQISPKMFEAISVGTVLVMYENGINRNYSDILFPGVHYIELKEDHSNIEDVITKIKDDEFLQNMANKAYKDIIESDKYSYRRFIELVDKNI